MPIFSLKRRKNINLAIYIQYKWLVNPILCGSGHSLVYLFSSINWIFSALRLWWHFKSVLSIKVIFSPALLVMKPLNMVFFHWYFFQFYYDFITTPSLTMVVLHHNLVWPHNIRTYSEGSDNSFPFFTLESCEQIPISISSTKSHKLSTFINCTQKMKNYVCMYIPMYIFVWFIIILIFK